VSKNLIDNELDELEKVAECQKKIHYLTLMVVNILCLQFEKARGIINNRDRDDIIKKLSKRFAG
jgi:hypothetical protein